MKSHFDEKLLQWKAASMKSRFNEKPLWWKAASMKSRFDEKLLWWKAASPIKILASYINNNIYTGKCASLLQIQFYSADPPKRRNRSFNRSSYPPPPFPDWKKQRCVYYLSGQIRKSGGHHYKTFLRPFGLYRRRQQGQQRQQGRLDSNPWPWGYRKLQAHNNVTIIIGYRWQIMILSSVTVSVLKLTNVHRTSRVFVKTNVARRRTFG